MCPFPSMCCKYLPSKAFSLPAHTPRKGLRCQAVYGHMVPRGFPRSVRALPLHVTLTGEVAGAGDLMDISWAKQIQHRDVRGWGLAARRWLTPQVRMRRIRNLAGKRRHCPWASLELPDADRALLWHQPPTRQALRVRGPAAAKGRGPLLSHPFCPHACVWDRLSKANG